MGYQLVLGVFIVLALYTCVVGRAAAMRWHAKWLQYGDSLTEVLLIKSHIHTLIGGLSAFTYLVYALDLRFPIWANFVIGLIAWLAIAFNTYTLYGMASGKFRRRTIGRLHALRVWYLLRMPNVPPVPKDPNGPK